VAAIKLGLYLSSNEVGPEGLKPLPFERLLTIAQEAEAAGWDSIWFPDHYFIDAGPGGRRGGPECWTLLTALAARTMRIRLGSLVLCNTFRHPAILAKQAATLQEISGGRVILGLGSGWHEPEYQALGLPFDHRVSRLAESAAAIRELFDTGTSNFKGRWLRLDRADLSPRPAQKVPFWIAAVGPRMLEITARYADGWNIAWFGANTGPFRKRAAQLVELARAAGRPADAITLTVGVQALVTAPGGEQEGFALARQLAPQVAKLDDAALRERVLVGDGQTVASALREYGEAGAALAIIGMPGLGALPADPAWLRRLLHDLPAALG
jgi:alkanesulfonate monooxygenase SsuD/methylene tetrahydromethanopterin reductase-like flavin-dependent oxidoreductase (luciferase family)